MPVVLATLCAAAYANTLHAPFVFDDFFSVVNNHSIRQLWPPWNALSPSHAGGTTVEGRPVLNFTFAVNYALGGLTPWGYHVVNLAIHILAGLTAFGVVRRTLLQPALRERFGATATELALVTAILWTLHPLQTESVTYVSQRAESLMGLFYLLTLYGFIRGTESPRAGLWFTLSFVACLLGMATKEVMVSAPLMVLLYDRTFVSGSFRAAWRRQRPLYLALGGTWILLGYLVATAGGRGGSAGFDVKILWWQYALTQTCAITHYLRLSVWPHPLLFDYGTDVVTDAWRVAPCAATIALLVIATAISLWRWPVIGFVACWFFAILAPSSSVVPVATQTVAEHRMYLPLLAIIAVTLAAAWRVCRRLSTRFNWPSANARVWLETAIGLTLAVALGVTTFQRNAQYQTAQSVWADVVAQRPHSARGETDLALALIDDGKTTDALPHFLVALRLDPDNPIIRNDYATALLAVGQVDEAIAQFQETLRRAPGYAPARKSLGLITQHQFRADIEHSQAALAAHPDDPAAHVRFAQLLADMGRRDEAITHYEQALRLDPSNASAHYNLANLLAEYGRDDEALSHYTAAARLAPNDPRIQINLGNLFLKQAYWDKAIAAYAEALRLDPTAFEAHNNIAIALANRGDLVQATAHFREAARLRPQQPEIHSELAEVLERQGLHDEAQRESAEAQRLTQVTPPE
jgi:tetratricopeptide (TPR) repeat protein